MAERDEMGEIEQLIEYGQTALTNGNAYEARKWFRLATEQYPDSGAAWFGLAQSVFPFKDKREYLLRALEIEPDYFEAQRQLEEVEKQIATGAVMAPRPSPPPTGGTEMQPITETDAPITDAPDAAATCINHPERETGLRCVQCGVPVCSECAKPAFVGQLCPGCARERRPINYQVSTSHLVIAGLISLIISGISSFLVLFFLSGIGFFSLLLVLFFSPLVAGLLLRILDYATRAKRGKAMQITVGVSIGAGALPLLLFLLLFSPFHFPTIILIVFVALFISTTIYRLR